MKKALKTVFKVVGKAALVGAGTYLGKLVIEKAVKYYKEKKEVKIVKVSVPEGSEMSA